MLARLSPPHFTIATTITHLNIMILIVFNPFQDGLAPFAARKLDRKMAV